MRDQRGKRRSSIFTRMMSTFLLVMLPVYALGIYIYKWGEQTVKDEIFKSSKAQVAFYLKRLEEEIERIKILQYDCLNDESLQKLALRSSIMDDYEKVDSIRQLHQRLATIKNSSSYIENVSVHIRPIQRTISANTAVNNFAGEKFENIRVPLGERGAQFVVFNGNLYLTTLHQGRSSGLNPLYSVEIELNERAFEEALEQFNTYADSGSFLIGISNNMVLRGQDGKIGFNPDDFLRTYRETETSGNGYSVVKGTKYYVLCVRSQYLNMLLLRYIPQQLVLTPIAHFYTWAWIFSFVAFLIIAIYSLFTYRLIHRPLLELVNAFQKVEKGDLRLTIDISYNNEFGYLYKRFNAMVQNLAILIDQVYKQKILMQRAELKQLQSQINPHFLYNSFFIINTMAQIGDENLIPFTKYLGEYFRFITRNTSDYISLSEEINHARTYCEIQLMRFSNRLEMKFPEFPTQYAEMIVPRLIVQPLVENAFQHAVERKKDTGIISVDFDVNEETFSVIVEDNGSEITEDQIEDLRHRLDDDNEEAETTGLLNIHRRVRLVYGIDCGLFVERSGLGGLKVMLRLRSTKRNRYV